MMKTMKYIFTTLLMLSMTLLSVNNHAVEIISYYHNDALGSPVASTDEYGNVLWLEHYRPYGDRVVHDSEADNNQLWYTGKPQDTETGLSYLGARYYDPLIGRFMSIDPVGFTEANIHSFNRYTYANNNPYRYTDPNGESPIDVVFLGIDAVKLASAIYSGVGINSAAKDFAASLVGVVNPVPFSGQALKVGRIAGKTTKSVGKEPNRIYSAQELKRRAENPRTNKTANPNHNFPESFNVEIFRGNKTIVSDKYHLYTKSGTLNGRSGVYEIGVKPSISGRTEVIKHRFFNPSKK